MKKINLAIAGASGKMGKSIIDSALKDLDINIHTLITKNSEFANHFTTINSNTKIIQNISDISSEIDVLIDFTRVENSLSILKYAEKNNISLVIGTTGFTEEQEDKIKQSSKNIPIVLAPNMSLGVNILLSLLKQATEATKKHNVDIEIIESHHNKKVDSPSGTALKIGEVIAESMGEKLENIANLERNNENIARKENEIGFSTIRAGNIIGDHSVMFAMGDEIITIKHQALTRSVFGTGAIFAAKWLVNQQNGMFAMKDVLL
jgi:4-hydroxy-tetrahydrodipicolinate reductase